MRKFVIGLLTLAMLGFTLVAAPQVARAWGEEEYTGNGKPQFNTYTNVPNVGDEGDFLRVGAKGANASTYTSDFEACEGEATLSVYIHNGAPEGFNGTDNTGTGVAKDTKLNIKTTNSKELQAIVSASNATPATVTDGAKITCKGEAVELEYVAGSARLFSTARGDVQFKDAVVNGGTLVGTYADDGVVPGCWPFRVYVSITVRIKKAPKPTKPVYECTSVKLLTDKDKKRYVKATVNGSASDGATIAGYEIDFGDGTKSNQQTAEHTYATDGEKTVTGTVLVKLPSGETVRATSDKCRAKVTFEGEKPPVVPPAEVPTTLPNTGAGAVGFGVMSVSSLAYGFRRWLESRRGLKG